REPLSPGDPGHPGGGTPQQRPLPVHPAGGQPARAGSLGASHAGEATDPPGSRGRQHRSAEPGARGHGHHRSGHRRAPRRHAPGVALGDAVTALETTARDLGLPPSIRATFQGTAQAFQASLANEPLLILAALVTVYIVLGVLYESYIHPLTILSTLPSAGVGAILALLLCRTDLSVIALIGIILLIGIVKKNAIMMIDFALEAERSEGKGPE